MAAKVVIAYVPGILQHYLNFFERHRDAASLYILSEKLISEFTTLTKDIRALPPRLVKRLLQQLRLFQRVELATPEVLDALGIQRTWDPLIIMPDEDVSRELAARHLLGRRVEFENVFLRWDKRRTLTEAEVQYDRRVPFANYVAELMGRALAESQTASDWWRQVGAVIVRESKVILAGANRHVPSPHIPYLEGSPRANFKQGEYIELTTDHHAEARLIAEAARKGISLEGTSIYVTTFPCPPCAKLIAYAGIRQCYYVSGYSLVDAERILRAQGVEIIQVEMKSPDS